MNYLLTYSCAGHQMTYGPTDLADINRTIRNLYDENDEIAILSVQEEHDGPRTWAIEYPPAPPAGTRMRIEDGDRAGEVLTMGTHGRIQMPSGANYSWKGVLEQFGPLTEVVETELEGAARRLREAGDLDSAARRDIDIVLRHVLGGGTL